MQFIVDVTNTHDKECFADITKASITGKAILTESELESVQNSTWLSMARNNYVYGFCVRILCKHNYVYIQINLNDFIHNALSLFYDKHISIIITLAIYIYIDIDNNRNYRNIPSV